MREYKLTHYDAYFIQRENNRFETELISKQRNCSFQEAIKILKTPKTETSRGKNEDIRTNVPVHQWIGNKKVVSPTKSVGSSVMDTSTEKVISEKPKKANTDTSMTSPQSYEYYMDLEDVSENTYEPSKRNLLDEFLLSEEEEDRSLLLTPNKDCNVPVLIPEKSKNTIPESEEAKADSRQKASTSQGSSTPPLQINTASESDSDGTNKERPLNVQGEKSKKKTKAKEEASSGQKGSKKKSEKTKNKSSK